MLFSVLRYEVKFQFNEDWTRAHLLSVFFGSEIPGKLQDMAFIEMFERADVATRGPWLSRHTEGGEGSPAVKLDGAWIRNNYAGPDGVGGSPGTGYVLLPVLTLAADTGAPVLHKRNLAIAKLKLGPGARAIRTKHRP